MAPTREESTMSQSERPVASVITPEPVVEGAGVHLRRSIGTRRLDHLDPFLLLDHFESVSPADYEAGFPYHPHRGIETVTLVRKGEVRHGDSLGHRGAIGAGDIQWMTSGSGIMHEEMPQVRPEGIAGLQLWLNLPAREKMSRPKYRDLEADRLTETATDGGATIRVIAGEADDGRLVGPVEGLAVAPKFVDVTLPPGTTFRERVPRGTRTRIDAPPTPKRAAEKGGGRRVREAVPGDKERTAAPPAHADPDPGPPPEKGSADAHHQPTPDSAAAQQKQNKRDRMQIK